MSEHTRMLGTARITDERRMLEAHHPENREKKRALLAALDEAVNLIKEKAANLQDKTDQKKYAWIIDAVNSARENLGADGYILVTDSAGHTQKEGIPLEGLIAALNEFREQAATESKNKEKNAAAIQELKKKIARLNSARQKNTEIGALYNELLTEQPQLSERFGYGKNQPYSKKGSAAHDLVEYLANRYQDEISNLETGGQKEQEKFAYLIALLKTNSKPYFEVHPDMRGDAQHWRTKLEAKLISLDRRATGTEPADYEQAMAVMDERRELLLPPEQDLVGTELTVRGASANALTTSESGLVHQPNEFDLELRQSGAIESPETGALLPAHIETEGQEQSPLPSPNAKDIRPPSRAFVIDISNVVERLAWTQAEEKLNAILRGREREARSNEGRGFLARAFGKVKDFVSQVPDKVRSTYVRLNENGYLRKFYQESLNAIQNNKNLMTEIEARVMKKSGLQGDAATGLDRHFRVLDNIIETFADDVAEEEERGEAIFDTEVNNAVALLIVDYLNGTITDRRAFDTAVEQEVLPILDRKGYKFSNSKNEADNQSARSAKGILYAHNFFEIAEGYRDYVEEKMEELMKEYGPENAEAIKNHIKGLVSLEIQLGLKERDIRDTKPAAVLTWTDKLIDRAQNIPVLGKIIANPLAVGAASGVAVAMAVRTGARASLRAIAAAPVVGGLLGGVLGAMRKGREMQYDRGTESRRKALGQEAGGKRAEAMRAYTYDMLNWEDTTGRLAAILDKPTTAITLEETNLVTEVMARLAVEKQAQVDMFTAAAEEGNNLGTRIASLNSIKRLLRDIQRRFPDQFSNQNENLPSAVNARVNSLLDHIDATDNQFKKKRRESMVKAGIFGAVVGVAAGAIGEAGVAAWRGHFDQSALGRLGEYISSHRAHSSFSTHDAFIPGSRSSIRLPNNLELTRVGSELEIINKVTRKVVVDHVPLNPDGTITTSGLDKINHAGLHVVEGARLNSAQFPGPTREVTLPGLRDARLKLPAGLEVQPNGLGGYDVVTTTDNRVIIPGLRFSGGNLTPVSQRLLHDMDWNVASSTGPGGRISDPARLRDYFRNLWGGKNFDITRRAYHENIDPASAERTGLDNRFFAGKITGGASEHHPYEYTTTDVDAAASERLLREGLIDHAVARGTVVKGTIFDGKQLRGIFMERDHDYILSFKRGIRDMMKHGQRNWDGSVDDKFYRLEQAVKAGDLSKFSFRVYLSKADYTAGHAISLPMDTKGEMIIPKGSDIANVLVDQKGHLNVMIEVAYDDPSKNISRVLAVMRGSGLREVVVAEGASIHELTPKPAGADYTIAPDTNIIPFPFVPRKPLEKGRRVANETAAQRFVDAKTKNRQPNDERGDDSNDRFEDDGLPEAA